MEKEYEAKTVMVQFECENCFKGFMICVDQESIQTDNGWDTVYNHVCNNCGCTKDFINIKYPYSKVIMK